MNIPRIGLGTFRLQDQVVIDAVLNGLAEGYRHIDTAQVYGNEAEVGKAIRQSGVARDALYLTTKIWLDNLSKNKLADSLKASLDKLQVNQVDLTLIHWPSPNNDLSVEEYMTALAEAQQQGLTRAIGVSNFTLRHLQRAIDIVGSHAIANQQIEIHPFLQNRKVVTFCQQQGIRVTAYMPLAYGKVMDEPVLQRIATQRQTTPALISLAWLLQQGLHVIPSSTQRTHLANNLKAADIVLSDDDMQAIAKLDRNERLANPDFSPQWD
ncbi:2,5-didehydrogluconate reductase DkgB [Chitinivorax sp. B]|uniref:2,5-didehydrogluconate reductase DkgB n=1 Tax=Chitinivorax sp. B TaxID=2502235 RepID=UPI0010FA0E84|nr:2,5-didehydrogluconate reductase DkgB [Chitinivorax sp. B]